MLTPAMMPVTSTPQMAKTNPTPTRIEIYLIREQIRDPTVWAFLPLLAQARTIAVKTKTNMKAMTTTKKVSNH